MTRPADLTDAIAALAPCPGALAGTLVLELCGDEPSGTFGTQILADLGATVIKIERFGAEPDQGRPDADAVTMDKAYFWGLNRNKLSLACNLKTEEGRDLLARLAEVADVVYDNHRVGVAKRLGADPDSLLKRNPRLVVCSVTGFGHTGPRAASPAYDVTIQALGGGMSLTGTGVDGAPPVRFGNPIGGIAGALYAVIGILAALRRSRRAGAGDRLDVGLMDAQLELHSYRVPAAVAGTVAFSPDPHRGGSGALPYGPFRTGDGGWFVLGITNQFWPTFCDLVARPAWKDDPRFRSEKLRQENEAALNAEVTEAMGQKPADAWQELFIEAGIPGAKVRDIREAFAHPHVEERAMLVDFPGHPLGCLLKVAGNPIKSSRRPDERLAPAPGVGEHTVTILAGLLGLGDAEIADLRAKTVVWFADTGASYDRHSVV